MSWTQVRNFNSSIATKIKNLCLGNVQSGFSIPGKYPTAWQAWLHTQQHTDAIPTGVDVPVFFSYTANIDGVTDNYGHIGVRLADGRFWSDGNVYASIEAYTSTHSPKYVGWGESVNDVAVIKGGDMPVKTSLSTARILAEEVLGRDRGKTHAGGFDGDLNAYHVNRDLTNEYIYQLWTSPEASAAQAVKDAKDSFYNTYKDKIAELSARPTKEELAKLGQELASEQTKVADAEKKLAEEQAKKSSDTELLDQAGNWLTKLINRLFKKG